MAKIVRRTIQYIHFVDIIYVYISINTILFILTFKDICILKFIILYVNTTLS